MKDAASFLVVSLTFGLGIFAIVAGPETMPNKAGLDKCLHHHPERYCHIANGFPVAKLDNSAQ